MKNKKIKIIICIAIILLLIVCTLIVISIMKKNKKNESKEEQQKRPDIIIQGTEEKPIELKGFEVTNIDIFKTSDTSLQVKATIVNKLDVEVDGFFIEIGLFDKKEKYITEVVKNYKEVLKPGESIIIQSNIVGLKKAKEVSSAKILRLERKNIDSMQDSLNTSSIKTGE